MFPSCCGNDLSCSPACLRCSLKMGETSFRLIVVRRLSSTMKVLSYILVMAGLIAAVIAVYLSRPTGVAEARVTVAEIIPAPSAPSPSSDLEQLNNEAIKARSVVTRKLSNLHSEKALSAAKFETYVKDLPKLDLQESNEGLKRPQRHSTLSKKRPRLPKMKRKMRFLPMSWL